ncbi:MAG: bifunctional metallophosphatase/5'-nucleotidase, partial [Bacteroidetes bacterium]
EVPLIMGGHEHDLHYDSVGSVHIAKADANAKTAWVHRFEVSKRPRLSHRLRSEVVAIDGDRPEDSAVAALVERWLRIQNAEIGKIGVDPAAVIYHAAEPLDGREKSIRNEQTNLGRLIAEAMYAAAAQPVDGALYNSGSVRIDDQLVGDLTAVDVFRALPFGGGLVEVTLEGSLLKKLLDQGQENKGKGGYLQWYRIRPTPNGWLIGDQPLDPRKSYRIVTTDFLLTGLESGMGFFTPENPGIHHIDRPNSPDDPRSDIRKAVIEWMKGVGGE